jgi:hypothetical protein
MTRRRTALFAWVASVWTAQTAGAFSFLSFPPQARVDSDQVLRWPDYADGQAFVLTYAIAPDFLETEDPDTRANVEAAIASALATWSDATNGLMRFERAEYHPYEMKDDADGAPPAGYVGLPFDDWFDALIACGGDQACIDALPAPGWGAHIDFFSRPPGYSFTFDGFFYELTECNLATTVIRRQGTTEIRSVDIYLNDKWDWTTVAEDVTPISAPVPAGALTCGRPGCRHAEPLDHASVAGVADLAAGEVRRIAERRDGERTDCSGLMLTVDLESVVLHEVGHAIGLDHPDQAPDNASPVLDPFTFEAEAPGFFVPGEVVMRSNYVGVKRELDPSDVGGMAFLYPPALFGDITSDGEIGVVDAVIALDAFEGVSEPDPWTVNRLDFNTRDGRIDLSELQQLLLWVVDPANNPPGEVPSRSYGGAPGRAPTGPTSIVIGGFTDPGDIGIGGTVDLTFTIDNPDQRMVEGWDLRVLYQSDVLTNPRLGASPTFLPGQALLPIQIVTIGNDVSELRTGSFGFSSDDSTSGEIVTITFDIDLVEAAAVSHVDFPIEQLEIVVRQPYSHAFGSDPNFPDETLTLGTVTVDAFHYDADGDGLVTLNDIYAFTDTPLDVNYDSQIDGVDRQALNGAIRQGESAEMVSGR